MIANTDTVVDPWAMMVETVDAPLACPAVPASRGPDQLAVRAELAQVLIGLQELNERQLCLKVPRISQIGDKE